METSTAIYDHNQNTMLDRKELDAIGHSYEMWWVITARMPVNPLQVFIQGMQKAKEGFYRFTHQQMPYKVLENLNDTISPLFPGMDQIFLIGIILSLLAVIFGYDSICGEKENGTLRLMLSCSVPRDIILLGKWLGGLIALELPFIISVICTVGILLVQNSILVTFSQWLRVAGIFGLGIVYIAAIYSISVCVSCFTAKASTSLIVLAAIWAFLILSAPNFCPHLARLIRPVESLPTIEMQRATMVQHLWKTQMIDAVKKWDKENGFGDPWWAGIDFSVWEGGAKRSRERDVQVGNIITQTWEQMLVQNDRLDEKYSAEIQEQLRTGLLLSRISPFTNFSLGAAEMAGQAISEDKNVRQQIRKYYEACADYDSKEGAKELKLAFDTQDKGHYDFRQMRAPFPIFTYKPSPISVAEIFLDFGLLIGIILFSFIVSFFAFLKYDVR